MVDIFCGGDGGYGQWPLFIITVGGRVFYGPLNFPLFFTLWVWDSAAAAVVVTAVAVTDVFAP